MGAANVEPEPFSVAGADDAEDELPVLELLELVLLEPHAVTPRTSTEAVAAASHLRVMVYFSFCRFPGRLAERRRNLVTGLWPGCEEVVNARPRSDIRTRNACG